MGHCATLLVGALILGPLSVQAEVFRWVDGEGTVHLTDNASTVPEDKREGAKVYESKQPAVKEVADEDDRSQVRFASMIAREFGLSNSSGQDPISLLNGYGIYPRAGWRPGSRLARRAAREVALAAELAAKNHRLEQSPLEARDAVLAAAKSLGLEFPPPEPPPAAVPTEVSQPLIISPEVVVEAPAPIIINAPQPLIPNPAFLFGNPAFLFGVPFAPGPVSSTRPPSRGRHVAHSFQVTRTTPLAPFRQRVHRGGFGTLATTPLASMFSK